MCRDVDGRQIKVGDYVERVKHVEGFQIVIRCKIDSGMSYSRTNQYRVSITDDYDYVGIDCETSVEWFSNHFRVVERGPPQTVRDMSYRILRELEKA